MRAIAIAERQAPKRPVAWLARQRDVVHAVVAEPSPELRALLTMAAGARPLRVVRQREAGGSGRSVLRERTIAWADDRALVAWADAITYSPAARGRFTAWVSDDAPAASQFVETLPPWYHGALVGPSPARPPRVTCPCGASYALGAPACRECGSEDPLTSLGGDIWESLRARFEQEVRAPLVPMALVLAAASLSARARSHAELLATPLPDRAGESDENGARVILAEFERRVALGRAVAGEVARLRTAATSATDEVLRGATATARSLRSAWQPDAVDGWRHSQQGVTALRAELQGRWQPALAALVQLRDAGVVAMARYAPVHRRLKKLTEPMDLSTMLRHAWTGVVAVKTFGASLIVKGAMWAFKEKKATQALEALDKALEAMRIALLDTARALDTAAAAESATADNRRRALAQNLLVAFQHDYAQAGGTRRDEIAGVARDLLGLSRRRPRPRPLANRIRARLALWCIPPLLIAVAVIVWMAVR